MKCYLFLTFAIGGSYPHPKGCELATAYLSRLNIAVLINSFRSACFHCITQTCMGPPFGLCSACTLLIMYMLLLL